MSQQSIVKKRKKWGSFHNKNPEWDPSPRRLMLSRIGKDIHTGEITSKFDHISPKDWHGDTTVARVNLNSCWLLGRQQAIAWIPDSGSVFEKVLVESDPSINMLSPLGMLLVNQCDQDPNGKDNNANDLTHNLSPEPIPSGAMQGVHNTQTSCKGQPQPTLTSTNIITLTQPFQCHANAIGSKPQGKLLSNASAPQYS